MARNTEFLGLTLPEEGEYDDTWWAPLNENFDAIDAKTGSIFTEIQLARGTKGSLQQYLLVGHDPQGNLLPTKEVLAGRVSPVYGHKTDAGVAFTLADRLAKSEREIWWAREGASDLRAGLTSAKPSSFPVILDGSKDANGYPTWFSRVAKRVIINGVTTPLKVLVGGQTSRVRTSVELSADGAAGTYYVTLTRNDSGQVILDGTSGTPEGTTSLDQTPEMTLFSATSITNWANQGVRVGDILEITGSSFDAGMYLIKEVGPDGDPTKLRIYGTWPAGGLSALPYKIYDPLGASLSLSTAETNSTSSVCIGEADSDGAAITAVRPRGFGDTYVSEWRAVNVGSGTSGAFEQVFSHAFGTNKLDVQVQISQTNTDKGLVEDLPTCSILNTMAVALGGTGASSTTATLSGAVTPSHGCLCKWDGYSVYLKNIASGYLYTDYTGANRQTGYIRVIARRRG